MKATYVTRGLTAIVVLFAIGCADGQRQSKGTNGKGKRMMRTQGPGGRTTPGKTNGDKSTTALPTASDSTIQKQIDASIDQLNAGVNGDFTAGTYQLVSTSSFFSFPMPSDYVQALSSTELDPERNFQMTAGPTLGLGVVSPKITQPTRQVGVPFELKITKDPSGLPTIVPGLEKILTSTVAGKNHDVSLKETWSEAAAAPKFGLMTLINSSVEKIEDGQGNSATVADLMLANGDLRFVIKIEETLPAPVSSTVYRNFYLTYRLKAGAPTPAVKATTGGSTPTPHGPLSPGDQLLHDAQEKTAGKF